MLLVNFLQLLCLLEECFSKNKVMEPFICLILICLPDDISEQRVFFLCQGPKPDVYLILAKKSIEALLMGALGGLVSFMGIYVKVPVKVGVGAFSNQQ